ncbi:DNA ligase [Trichinella pseudospiralis]
MYMSKEASPRCQGNRPSYQQRSMQIPRATYCFEKNRLNSDLENIMHRLDCRRNCALLRFNFSWFWAIHRGDPDES